jgi:hypothetical protein
MAGFFAHNGRGGARHGGHASSFVMPGLDSGIHAEVPPADCAKPLSMRSRTMDCRIKFGNDDEKVRPCGYCC